MKDIPFFTCEAGVATLILREIPRKGWAYVLPRSWQAGQFPALLEKSRRFCVMAGAARVSAGTDEPMEDFAHLHDLVEMRVRRADLPAPNQAVRLVSVGPENEDEFLRIYNELFMPVPNAATYMPDDLERILREEQAVLAEVGGRWAGIGEWRGSELRAVGVLPEFRGLGAPLTLALLGRMEGGELTLRVSTANPRAVRLYERLGFRQTAILSRWYELTPGSWAGVDIPH